MQARLEIPQSVYHSPKSFVYTCVETAHQVTRVTMNSSRSSLMPSVCLAVPPVSRHGQQKIAALHTACCLAWSQHYHGGGGGSPQPVTVWVGWQV